MSHLSDYLAGVPMPEMPPHGSADPSSPNFNPERAKWIDDHPTGTAEWQAWIQGREHAIDDDLLAGMSGNQAYELARGDEGRKEGRPDQLVRDYISEREGEFNKRGLNYAIQYGHAFADPGSGTYYNYDPRTGEFTFRDARTGQNVGVPNGAIERIIASGGLSNFTTASGAPVTAAMGGYGGAYGGTLNSGNIANPQKASAQNAASSRPYLKEPNDSYYRGWENYFGQGKNPTKKKPVASYDPYGDLRTNGSNPYGLPEAMTGSSTYYIPGLSQRQE